MNRSPMELGRERCAIALRRGLAASGRYATIKELAAATGINYSTLGGYFQGRKLPSEEIWHVLRAALGFVASSQGPSAGRAAGGSGGASAIPSGDRRRKRSVETKTAAPSAGTVPRSSTEGISSPSDEAVAHAREIRQQIQSLSNLLDFFKRGSSSDRDALRRVIPGRDMGYLTSLLRALYDEDQFEAWILFSEYAMGEDEP